MPERMIPDDDHRLAAEWALGTLEEEAGREAVRRLEREPGFAALVARWEDMLHRLDDREEIEPSAGLWDRIGGAIDDAAVAPGTQTIRADSGVWETLVPGVERRVLFVDRVGGTQSYYVRMKAGAKLPQHAHSMTEQCVVLEGTLRVGELTFGAGDFHVGFAENDHPAITAVTDAVFFIHGQL